MQLFKTVITSEIQNWSGGENMPYNELIKNFNIIRDYVRDFYVYGFDSREDYNRKSKRT